MSKLLNKRIMITLLFGVSLVTLINGQLSGTVSKKYRCFCSNFSKAHL